MTPLEYENLRRLFFEVADLAPEARRSVLDEKCGKEPMLRSRIEKMLGDPGSSADMLRDALAARGDSAECLPFPGLDEPVPDGKKVGKYTIVTRIGQGGMGTVYEARQSTPNRTVALKIIQTSIASDATRSRFHREADALARLQHPGIAQIYDAQVADFGNGPQAYLAMEFVRGSTLVTYANSHGLTERDRLELFVRVAEAVHHAHQKGVIHRDLKPDNILIDGEGHPKVVDFGVARLLGTDAQPSSFDTELGQVVGTLAYMSPEQATGRSHDVDVRSDVYSLGVILFELLVNRLPNNITGLMLHEAVRKIAEDEPQRLGSIDPTLRGDVDAIVGHALAKDQQARYQSASDLARDIEHYLNGEPIDAKRANTWYVFRKSIRRYRIAAGVALAFVLLLGVSTIALSIMYRNQSHAREAADQARTSEEEQRKLAEQRESEAVAARVAEKKQRTLAEKREADAVALRREAQKRATELQTVTEFQQSMLGDIDAEKMGRGIMAALREGIRKGLEKRDTTPPEVEASLASFDRLVGEVNPTNLALNVVKENALSNAVEAINRDFAEQPLIRAALQQTVADTYREIGLYEPALPLLEASLRTRRSVLGDEHSDTLSSNNSMGRMLKRMGQYNEAWPYYRKALDGSRRVLGDDHPLTLEVINNIGDLLESMGKFGEATVYYNEALQHKRRLLGNDHPSTLISINDMGGLLIETGKYAEAEPYCREALKGRRRVLGNDHPSTLMSIGNMGLLLQEMGKYAEALPFYREALKGHRGVRGDDHPETLKSIENMGDLLNKMGKNDEALPYYRESLNSIRRVLGDDHPDTLRSINNMGSLLRAMGKYEEAEPYFLEALEGRRRVLGDDHPDTLMSIGNMGALFQSMGKYAKVEPYYRAALEGHRRVRGDDHPVTLISINNMGTLLQMMGKSEEAEPYYIEALERSRRVLGKEHPDTLGSISNMGALLQEMGKYEEARLYYREALKGRRRVLGDDHPSTLKSINNMGSLLESMGKYAEAEPYLREALENKRRVLGDDHPNTLISIHNMGGLMCDLGRLKEAEALGAEAVRGANAKFTRSHGFRLAAIGVYGHTLADLHRYSEAEGHLLEAHEGFVTTLGPNHRRTVKTIKSLIDLYDDWHAAEPDKGYAAKASEWRAKLPRPVDEAKSGEP